MAMMDPSQQGPPMGQAGTPQPAPGGAGGGDPMALLAMSSLMKGKKKKGGARGKGLKKGRRGKGHKSGRRKKKH